MTRNPTSVAYFRGAVGLPAMLDNETWLKARVSEKAWKQLGSDLATIRLQVARLTHESAALRVEIEQILPFADLEEALLAYDRKPMAIGGSAAKKASLESDLARYTRWLERAKTMEQFVQFEDRARSDVERNAMGAKLQRAFETCEGFAECDNYVRYLARQRSTYDHNGALITQGPTEPKRVPPADQLKNYRELKQKLDEFCASSPHSNTMPNAFASEVAARLVSEIVHA